MKRVVLGFLLVFLSMAAFMGLQGTALAAQHQIVINTVCMVLQFLGAVLTVSGFMHR